MLGGASSFSSLDMAHGYFQVQMHPDSMHLTAFRVPWGLYEFERMPQGLCTSPSTFQCIMEYLFGDMNLVKVLLYLDDILVFAPNIDEHIKRLDEVLARLISAGLKPNKKKCRFFQPEVKYLGHLVSSKGISADPEKVDKVRNWPVPTNSEQLSSFLGLTSYYRRFINGFAEVAAPLHAVVVAQKRGEPTSPMPWTPEADRAFSRLKILIPEAPVLAYPQFDKDFVLEIDASLKGLGACLSQFDSDGVLHPVAFASRALRGAECRYPDYSSFKLELLGLKWAVADKFGDLLNGSSMFGAYG